MTLEQAQIDVLALDLEATLISDVFSRIPRPGLRPFLEFCHDRFSRIVIFTAASEAYFREVAIELVDAGHAPAWFSSLEYIEWDRDVKDLRFIPHTSVEKVVLVDDYPPYIHPDQTDHWIEIQPFDEGTQGDEELARVQAILAIA